MYLARVQFRDDNKKKRIINTGCNKTTGGNFPMSQTTVKIPSPTFNNHPSPIKSVARSKVRAQLYGRRDNSL